MTSAATRRQRWARLTILAFLAMPLIRCAGDRPDAAAEGPAGLAVRVTTAEGVVLEEVELDLFGLARLDVERLAGELPLDGGLRLYVEGDRTVRASWLAADGARLGGSADLPLGAARDEGSVAVVLGGEPEVTLELAGVAEPQG